MKKTTKGIVARWIQSVAAHWEVVAVLNPKRKKIIRFKDVGGKIHSGPYEFATRLVARNGNVLCINPRQFNTIAGALKNIKSVKNSA